LQLDGLRAVAVLAVLVHHALRVPLLWVGVDVFFVLSGFLITGILLRRKESQANFFGYFYERRFFRIIPPYAAAIFVAGMLFGWSGFRPWYVFVFFLMNLSGLYFPAGATGLPLWSLAVEEQFYLAWPILVLQVSERTLLRIAVTVVLLTPFLRAICTPLFPSHYFIYYLTPFRADLLCAGAALAILWRRENPNFEGFCRRSGWVISLSAFSVLAFTQHWPSMRLINNTPEANALVYSLVLVGAISLLAWVLYDRGPVHRFLMWTPVRFIGRISYTMYLMGTVIRVVVLRYIHSQPAIVITAITATILYATISWYLMEAPLLRLSDRITKRRKDRSATGAASLPPVLETSGD
jgi:peptidoglycan/LPS O-acetylase OafA/YrhL